MRNSILAGSLAAIGTGSLIVADHNDRTRVASESSLELISSRQLLPERKRVHAAGRIEGTTETVLIRPHFPGRIERVAVRRGSKVRAGDPLFILVSDRFSAQADLAHADLMAAEAAKTRLIDGARESEIEAAKQEAMAAETRMENARLRFERAERLFAGRAMSQQMLDDQRAEFQTRRALLLAAQERLQTVMAPPRRAELLSAEAQIASARARLAMAEIDLKRCSILAPCDGDVLAVDIRAGEWISPEMPDAAIELVDTGRLRVVAEVDEHDALQVRLGQTVQVSADALPGKFFAATVTELEPRMEPKKIYGGWAGERNEAHARRVWIDFDSMPNLPVGLPIEVVIDVGE